MRILFLSPRQVLPVRNGARLREYHFMRALGAFAEVTHVYFSDPGAQPLTEKDLPFCKQVVAVPRPPAYTLAKTLKGAVGRWPLPILNYTSAEMSGTVARLTRTSRFDVIHLESIHMIRYALEEAARNPGVRAIYNWHNIESEAMRRYGQSAGSILRRLYAKLTAGKIEALEASLLKSAFAHIVCSDRERDQLRRMAPDARIATVENGVDTHFFSGADEEPNERRRIVFVGAMDYFPNVDAALLFAKEVWPRIAKRGMNLELTIVGANPGAEVRALGDLPGVTVTGTVPDVRPFYRDALAAVVPLRTGGGTRLKILEAMAAGVPVISTPLGAEGLDVTDGENIHLVNAGDLQGWADKLQNLIEAPLRRTQLTRSAYRLVEERYDWTLLGDKLRDNYLHWLQGSSDR